MRKHFFAKINVDGKQIGLGSFHDVKSAYEAYRAAKKTHHGVDVPDFESYGVPNVESQRD